MDQAINAFDAADAWRGEVGHHVVRALQEEYMAMNAAVPAAKIAHSAMCDCHLALAKAAEMAASMPDPTEPHPFDAKSLGAALRGGCPVHLVGAVD